MPNRRRLTLGRGDCIADLSEALDHIHHAKGGIEDERHAR